MKPFLKWAGNKYQIIDRITAILPDGDRLIEPFAGSCAVFLNTDYKNYLLGDTNADLIHLFQHVQREGSAFIEYCREFFTEKNKTETQYYALREEFNATKNQRLKSALFLYLNKHAYNGLCRYNNSGKFNAPCGRYKTVYFPEKELIFFHRKAQSAEFVVASFEDTLRQAKHGDVVYCDPPYVPLSLTASFTSYSAGGFSLQDQKYLGHLAEKLSAGGVPVIISNHNTALVRQIYKTAEKITFDVQRFISCDGANRKKSPELLAIF